jgi:hypothetical protein
LIELLQDLRSQFFGNGHGGKPPAGEMMDPPKAGAGERDLASALAI